MGLNQWFEKGFTKEEYIGNMQVNQAALQQIYAQYDVTNVSIAQSLREKQLRAIILTADWCGDAMVNLPIFMKIAEEAHIPASYLIRDNHLELMDQYLTNGTARSIPIIIFIDSDGNEVAKWGPRAKKIQQLVDEKSAQLPNKEDEQHEEAFKAYVQQMKKLYTEDSTVWRIIEEDLLQTLRTKA